MRIMFFAFSFCFLLFLASGPSSKAPLFFVGGGSVFVWFFVLVWGTCSGVHGFFFFFPAAVFWSCGVLLLLLEDSGCLILKLSA